MTTVRLTADSVLSAMNLELSILFLEEQQGYTSSQRHAATPHKTADSPRTEWTSVIETPVAAPDILAHFALTREAKTSVAKNIVTIVADPYNRYRVPDPRDIEPLTYADAKPF